MSAREPISLEELNELMQSMTELIPRKEKTPERYLFGSLYWGIWADYGGSVPHPGMVSDCFAPCCHVQMMTSSLKKNSVKKAAFRIDPQLVIRNSKKKDSWILFQLKRTISWVKLDEDYRHLGSLPEKVRSEVRRKLETYRRERKMRS